VVDAPSDTSPAARSVQLEIYRRMTPAEKFALVFELIETTEQFARVGIRLRHPGASEREVTLRLAELKYGRAWLRRHAQPLFAELPA